ncbi:hypothetical protein GIB67_015625 [Kingdonia uniflora]|uniref:Uncharacterized protein n=1 Tax=Kingdonia uniflora TaxID=39325 RepID=A0A7J7NU89_9MAGN|nr:hypothetical protein GIB67_015625 [Kingdonia uniflora]
MKLTNKQRGVVKQELYLDYGSGPTDLSTTANNIMDGAETLFYREVGMKSKREDDVEWEEAPPNTGIAIEPHRVCDLNLQAGAMEDDEDDTEWEEG